MLVFRLKTEVKYGRKKSPMKELLEQDEYLPFGEPAHFMQRDILTLIKESTSPLTYSEIKPEGVDGNAFNHHLKSLVDKGILIKLDDSKYVLSAKGRRGVDFYSLEDSRVKVRPVAGVFILVESADGMIMTYRNEAAPTFGHTGLLFGKLRLGESYQKTKTRMLERRLLEAEQSSLGGVLNIRYIQGEELVAHRCGPLFIVKVSQRASQQTEYGSSTQKISWTNRGDVVSEEIKEALKLQIGAKASSLDLEIIL